MYRIACCAFYNLKFTFRVVERRAERHLLEDTLKHPQQRFVRLNHKLAKKEKKKRHEIISFFFSSESFRLQNTWIECTGVRKICYNLLKDWGSQIVFLGDYFNAYGKSFKDIRRKNLC